jgi:predicted hotdog family 3-hydroxylacyl-ACP dehydratase
MFCEPEGLPTWSSIELMAQTSAPMPAIKDRLRDCHRKLALLGTVKCSYLVPILVWDNGADSGRTKLSARRFGQFNCEIEYQEHQFSAILSVFEPENMNEIIGN